MKYSNNESPVFSIQRTKKKRPSSAIWFTYLCFVFVRKAGAKSANALNTSNRTWRQILAKKPRRFVLFPDASLLVTSARYSVPQAEVSRPKTEQLPLAVKTQGRLSVQCVFQAYVRAFLYEMNMNIYCSRAHSIVASWLAHLKDDKVAKSKYE